jgi:glycosyltransferase involved in cell wall biosynthesis
VGSAKLILFFGQLKYPPNAQALRTITERILPRLDSDFRLLVVGGGLSSGSARRLSSPPRLILAGPVENIADYIRAADVVAVPLEHGTGTRLKILESVACGVPVLSTSIGAEGLNRAALGDHVIVEDDWKSWPDALVQAAGLKHRPPRDAFVEYYDWRNIVRRINLPRGLADAG